MLEKAKVGLDQLELVDGDQIRKALKKMFYLHRNQKTTFWIKRGILPFHCRINFKTMYLCMAKRLGEIDSFFLCLPSF